MPRRHGDRYGELAEQLVEPVVPPAHLQRAVDQPEAMAARHDAQGGVGVADVGQRDPPVERRRDRFVHQGNVLVRCDAVRASGRVHVEVAAQHPDALRRERGDRLPDEVTQLGVDRAAHLGVLHRSAGVPAVRPPAGDERFEALMHLTNRLEGAVVQHLACHDVADPMDLGGELLIDEQLRVHPVRQLRRRSSVRCSGVGRLRRDLEPSPSREEAACSRPSTTGPPSSSVRHERAPAWSVKARTVAASGRPAAAPHPSRDRRRR